MASITAPNLNQSQLDYFDKKYGGINNYAKTQNERYAGAMASGDNDLISRLRDDAARVGYTLNAPNQTQTTGNSSPSLYQQGSSLIDQMNSAAQAARMQALKKQQETALQGLSGIETQAKQSAYDNRNQADAANMQMAQRLREAMAEQGLLSSGDNLTNISQLNAAKQSAMGQINQQESNALRDVEERRGIINNNAALDEAALIKELQAQRAEQMLGLLYRSDDSNFRNAQLMGMLNGQKTMDRERLDWDMNPNNPSNQSTIIRNQIDQLKLQNLPEEMKLSLDILKQQVDTGALNYQEAQYRLGELTNPNSVTNRMKQLELVAKELGNEELRKRIAEIGKTPVLSEHDKQIQELKLQQLQAQVDKAKADAQKANNPPAQTQKPTSVKDAQSMINSSRFVQKDPYGNITVPNTQALSDYIFGFNLPKAETMQLHQLYGLPWKD